MRKSIAIAATLVAGASATTVGAYTVPTTYFGSDTLFVVTQTSITDTPGLGAGLAGNYLAGGSGAGQGAMAVSGAASTAGQLTAPMSKMMTNGVCNALTGTNGSAATNASGIVIGMDAVDLLSSVTSGGASSCNGTSGVNPPTSGVGQGSAYSGTAGVFTGSTTNQNWKWILALLYGGLDLSPGAPSSPDCNSQARQNLVANWSLLFQNGCANGAAACGDTAHKAGGATTAMWHAFRRDDASGTSDVFSAIIGLQTWLGGGPSGSSNNGFGASPYCNAMNWDTNVVTNGTGTAVNCAAGAFDQFVGPGGIVDPSSKCQFADFKSGDLKTAETCGAAGSGNHRSPPVGAYGYYPDYLTSRGTLNAQGVQTALGTPAAGQPGWDVLPTSFQDNDPIRRTCIGTTVLNPASSSEEVCNTDGKLGVVLAIPSSDFIPTTSHAPVQYPDNKCTGTYYEGLAPNLLVCAPARTSTHAGECPNGDALFAGTQCATPVDDSTSTVTSQCLNNKSPTATITTRNVNTLPTASVLALDARVHNLFMYDGTVAGQQPVLISETIQNGKSTPPAVDFAGGMGRIHTVATIKVSGAPTNIGCQLTDATDQINCLVQADPCSVGYAGDGGKTFSERANGACAYLTTTGGLHLCQASGSTYVNGSGGTCPVACTTIGTTSPAVVSDAIRMDQVYPTSAAVLALGQQTTEYQIGRKLYFNSIVGFDNSLLQSGNPEGQLALGEFETNESNIAPILTGIGYFPLAGATSNATFNQPFCEDFNEQTVCNPVGTQCSTTVACKAGQTCTSTTATPGLCGTTCNNTTPCTGNLVCTSTTATNGACVTATNVNGCTGNSTAVAAYSASGTVPAATTPPVGGSICGDGNIDPFEECDDGVLNGTGGDTCSSTCRCSGTTSYENTGSGYHCQ
jgi:cysteine-rich repeat protein